MNTLGTLKAGHINFTGTQHLSACTVLYTSSLPLSFLSLSLSLSLSHTHTHTHTHTDVTYTLSGDTQNVERRIIFDANNVTMVSRSTTINMNDPAPGSCEDFRAYVRVCAYIRKYIV